jgi:hypothetical protein
MTMSKPACRAESFSRARMFQQKRANSQRPIKRRQVKSKIKSTLIVFFVNKRIIHK